MAECLCESAAAEPPSPARVRAERLAEVALAEVGPEPVDEHELGIRKLPEHEVGDAELSGGSNQKVRIGKLRRIEQRREHVLVDLLRIETRLDDPARRLDELAAAAVVERDPEVQPLVG